MLSAVAPAPAPAIGTPVPEDWPLNVSQQFTVVMGVPIDNF
ncbi:MAG: hypothetical protein VYA84_20160 [Planctomycetota bacterium]|nr:hypothetical protein [Planctomycetota bacterium]